MDIGNSGIGKLKNAERGAKRGVRNGNGEGELVEPLNAWARQLLAKQVEQVEVHRVDTVRLVLAPQQEELLRRAAEAAAKFIESENLRRRQLFFEKGVIDDAVVTWMTAWEMRKTVYLETYEALGSKNFREACEVVGEQWKSFKELLKLKERLKLEPNPPSGKRKKMVVFVGHDNYRVNVQRKVLHLGYWNIEVAFKGELRWLPQGKQGRLIIVYDPMKGKWYARVSVEVPLQTSSRSTLKAGVDLGREILAAVAVEDGHALLYRGGVLKSDYYYFERKIGAVDRTLSDPKSEEMDRAILKEERRRLYDKRRRRREQIFANTAAHLAKMLKALNVDIVFIGYPRSIAHDAPGKGNSNAWSYWKLLLRLAATLENHGVAAFAVPEEGTSKLCARHGCEVVRMPRGLVKCPRGHVMHSDVNAALNILRRGASALGLTVELPERVKVLSFIPTPERVIERKRKAHNPAV